MKLDISVIVPCYNEKETILSLINKINDVAFKKEIIVVCDGSTDGTREILKKMEKQTGINDLFKVIYHESNKGKGASVKTGLAAARGKIAVIQDADLELSPSDYINLLEPFKKGAQVVFGTRFKNNRPKIAFYSRFANWCVTWLANLLYNANISDEACGYKIMSVELYRSLNLECSGFDFCPEVTAKVCRKGYKIFEVPVQFNPRTFKEGKKIHWKHGFEAVWKLIKYRIVNVK